MDGTDNGIDDCCLRCHVVLDKMTKWFYMDSDGRNQGPFDTFSIMYFIYLGYFEEDSIIYKCNNHQDSRLNVYNICHYLNQIVDEFKLYCKHVFSCKHYIKNLQLCRYIVPPSSQNVKLTNAITTKMNSVSLTPLEDKQEKAGIMLTNDSTNTKQHKSIQQRLLESRLKNDIMEAQAHLSRITNRKVTHVIEKHI